MVAEKPSRQVGGDTSIVVGGDERRRWVSRGGSKLADGLADLGGPDVFGALALDAGASTGGFTHVLLEAGATHVVAMDVGHGQLAWPLQQDSRVTVLDRKNARTLTEAELPYRPTLIVADLSFISLRTVLPPLAIVAAADAEWLLLVKPQFEVGRGFVGLRGVVSEPRLWKTAVRGVADAAFALGLGTMGVVASRHPGPAGNVEFFLWLRGGVGPLRDDELSRVVGRPPVQPGRP